LFPIVFLDRGFGSNLPAAIFFGPHVIMRVSILPRVIPSDAIDAFWFPVITKLSLALSASRTCTTTFSASFSMLDTTTHHVAIFDASKPTVKANELVACYTLGGKPAESDVLITTLFSAFRTPEGLRNGYQVRFGACTTFLKMDRI